MLHRSLEGFLFEYLRGGGEEIQALRLSLCTELFISAFSFPLSAISVSPLISSNASSFIGRRLACDKSLLDNCQMLLRLPDATMNMTWQR